MTFHYPDISNVGNHGLTLDRNTLAVCAKATEGTNFKDPSYADFRTQAASLHAYFLAYHWTWCIDPQAEAQNAFNMIGPHIGLMWDVENLQKLQSVSAILDLTDRYRKLGGTVGLVYLPHWYWERIGSPDLRPLADAGLRLVSSNYRPYSDTGDGWQSYGGVTPYVWQYTNAMDYSGQKVDFNACKDSLSSFIQNTGVVGVFTGQPQPGSGDTMLTHWTTVKSGSTGQGVRVAQGTLIANGYGVGSRDGKPDGVFGPATDASTRDLQRRFGISVDGEFGPHTLSVALYGHDYA